MEYYILKGRALQLIFIYFLFFFGHSTLCSLGWSRTQYVAKVDLGTKSFCLYYQSATIAGMLTMLSSV